jgi:hypothetical protein
VVAADHATLLVAPDQVEKVVLRIDVPRNLPDDEYGGALLLQGFRDGAIAVRLHIGPPAPASPPKKPKGSSSGPKRSSRRTRA